MKNNNNNLIVSLNKSDLGLLKPARDEVVRLLQGSWTDVELLYLANDKRTILEREFVNQEEGIYNKVIFSDLSMNVCINIEHAVLNQVEEYTVSYTIEDNKIIFTDLIAEQVKTIEIMAIDENELWVVFDTIVVEDFSKDIEHNTMYEVVRFIKC